jgi:hypothetical protein
MRVLLPLAIALTACHPIPVPTTPTTPATPPAPATATNATQVVGIEMLQQEIDGLEREVQQMQVPVPRAADWDAAGARDQVEHDQIAEGMLFMVLAAVKDPTELPVRGVFIRTPDSERLAMVQVARLPDEVARRLRLSGPIGRYAWAGLYFAPYARHMRGEVEIDFAAHRQGMVVAPEFPASNVKETLVDSGRYDLKLSAAALRAMIAREYPAFVVVPDVLETLERLSTSAR